MTKPHKKERDDEAKLYSLLNNIRPGEAIMYHEGNLAAITSAFRIRDLAWRMHREGRVELYQKREGEGHYLYFALGVKLSEVAA